MQSIYISEYDNNQEYFSRFNAYVPFLHGPKGFINKKRILFHKYFKIQSYFPCQYYAY